jgi:segregation and condensation protein B
VWWRKWKGSVATATLSARDPLPRETLARLIGQGCNLDVLLTDIVAALRRRPYDIVFVAGGWRFRARPRFAGAIRVAVASTRHDSSLAREMVQPLFELP